MDLDQGRFPKDRGHFLDAIGNKAALLEAGHAAGRSHAPGRLHAEGLLFSGMGFSGVSADLVKDACTRALTMPFTVVKHYQFPHHVTKDWQCLAVSYSGDTEETLSVAQAALDRGVPVTAFTSGGTLAKMAPVVPQPEGYQPRAAFAYAWMSILGFMEASGLLGEKVPVRRAVAAVSEVDEACHAGVPEKDNEAKRLARMLWEKVPQIYATPAFYGVGKHFRGMLNENAKKIADVDLVPECNHNDLSGWGEDPNRKHFTCLALSHANQNPQIKSRLAFMQERYTKWGVPWHHHVFAAVTTMQEHIVEQARAIQLLDYTSFYIAMLRGVDPSEIHEIRALKERLRVTA